MAGLGTKGFTLPGRMSNVKVILNGGQNVTFLRPDGYFSLYPNIYQFLCIILIENPYLLVIDFFFLCPFNVVFLEVNNLILYPLDGSKPFLRIIMFLNKNA